VLRRLGEALGVSSLERLAEASYLLRAREESFSRGVFEVLPIGTSKSVFLRAPPRKTQEKKPCI